MKTTLKLLALLAVAVLVADSAHAQETVYVTPTSDQLEVYIAAAISKKKVPVLVTTKPESATFVMKVSDVEVKQVSTGAKWVNCLFAYCAGNGDKSSASVQLVDAEGLVLWSYSVNKARGEKNKQSIAEAIAKHFHDDYLKKRPSTRR